jgi:hypothetical protein
VQPKGAEHHGCVAAGFELLPLRFQAPPQFAEVIDLAIENHDVTGHRVYHGLGTGR